MKKNSNEKKALERKIQSVCDEIAEFVCAKFYTVSEEGRYGYRLTIATETQTHELVVMAGNYRDAAKELLERLAQARRPWLAKLPSAYTEVLTAVDV